MTQRKLGCASVYLASIARGRTACLQCSLPAVWYSLYAAQPHEFKHTTASAIIPWSNQLLKAPPCSQTSTFRIVPTWRIVRQSLQKRNTTGLRSLHCRDTHKRWELNIPPSSTKIHLSVNWDTLHLTINKHLTRGNKSLLFKQVDSKPSKTDSGLKALHDWGKPTPFWTTPCLAARLPKGRESQLCCWCT